MSVAVCILQPHTADLPFKLSWKAEMAKSDRPAVWFFDLFLGDFNATAPS